MTKFTNVIVRTPGQVSWCEGITSRTRSWASPIYERAVRGARRLHRGPEGMRRGSDRCCRRSSSTPTPASWRTPRSSRAAAPSSRTRAPIQPQRREGRDRAGHAPVLRRRARQAHRRAGHAGRRRRHDGGRPLLRGSFRSHERGGHPPVHRDPGGLGPRGLRGAAGGGAAPEDRRELPGGRQHAGVRRVHRRSRTSRSTTRIDRCPRTRPTAPTASGSTAPSSCPRATPPC